MLCEMALLYSHNEIIVADHMWNTLDVYMDMLKLTMIRNYLAAHGDFIFYWKKTFIITCNLFNLIFIIEMLGKCNWQGVTYK